MQQNPLPSSVTGIDSLIHAAGHHRPLAPGLPATDLAPLLDDVRDAMVAIYCDHDAQAAIDEPAWSLLEEAAFHLRLHHPWSALSALRQAGDALLMVRLDGGSA